MAEEGGRIGDHLSDDELSRLVGELLQDPSSGVKSASVPAFEEVSTKTAGDNTNVERLMDVALNVRVELGRTMMYVEDILHLAEGAVVQLDKMAGDPVDVIVNGRLVARGEILVLNDNFCVRITEIVDPEERAL